MRSPAPGEGRACWHSIPSPVVSIVQVLGQQSPSGGQDCWQEKASAGGGCGHSWPAVARADGKDTHALDLNISEQVVWLSDEQEV